MYNKPQVIGSSNVYLYAKLQSKAREMRQNPIQAEGILWYELKNKKLGVKFRRQHIIGQFIVDFYCISLALVIEVDGETHKLQKEKDDSRTQVLENLGCTVIRFTNREIIEKSNLVISTIKKFIKSPL